MDRPAFCYRFGTAEFDEARFELRVAGLPVDVERRALEVLLYLLRHAGEVVTKDELLSEVWAGRITVDKVLPNAINKLRRALGEANADLISTQARIGYRLDGVVTRAAVGRTTISELAFEAGQSVLVLEEGQPEFIEQEIATILRRARERSELRVVDDQRGAPTSAAAIAAATSASVTVHPRSPNPLRKKSSTPERLSCVIKETL